MFDKTRLSSQWFGVQLARVIQNIVNLVNIGCSMAMMQSTLTYTHSSQVQHRLPQHKKSTEQKRVSTSSTFRPQDDC